MKESFESVIGSSKESITRKIKQFPVFLALLASPMYSNAQEEMKNSSPEQYKQNIELLHEITFTPENIKMHDETVKDSMAFTSYSYRFDFNSSINIDSIAQAPLDTNYKYISLAEMRDYNDSISDSPERKGFQVIAVWGQNKLDNKREEISCIAVDTNRDGQADMFTIDDDIYGENFLKQKKTLFGRRIHIEPKEHQTIINTNEYDSNKDYYATREEVLATLGEEKGKEILERLDQKYNEAIKILHEKFISPEETSESLN